MDTHITIFLALIVFCFSMGIIGIWKRIPLLMFIGGAIIAFWAISTDNIILETISSGGDTTTSESFIGHMQQNLGTSPLIVNTANNIFVGEEVVNSNSTLYLKTFDEATMAFTKTGAPTGTAIVGVWGTQVAPSATNFLYKLGSFDVATLGGSITVYNFRNATIAYTLLDNQAIGVFFNGGSVGNAINVMTTSMNVFDGTNSQTTRYSAIWTDVTTDVRMNVRLTSISEETTITNEDIIIPFEIYSKIFFGLIGSMLLIAGALIWKYEED